MKSVADVQSWDCSMRVDLHIHSALSPCASDDMTPNNIVNMAKLCGLDLISVCDHNSLGQQAVMGRVAEKLGMGYVYGVEVQSIEEVHICVYFLKLEEAMKFDEWIKLYLPPIPNDTHYFGNQWLFDEMDEVRSSEKVLLIQSIDKSIDEIAKTAHRCHGLVSLAHVCDKSNSILTQLGFIPKELEFDMIEVKNEAQKERVMKQHPWIEKAVWIRNSDAHYLQDIDAFEEDMNENSWKSLWRKVL